MRSAYLAGSNSRKAARHVRFAALAAGLILGALDMTASAHETHALVAPAASATTSALFKRLNSCGTTKTAVASSVHGQACHSYTNCSRGLVECTFVA